MSDNKNKNIVGARHGVPLLIIITLIWFAVILSNFYMSFKDMPKEKARRGLTLADNFADYTWAFDGKEKWSVDLREKFFRNALDVYYGALVESSADEKIVIRAAVLNYELGDFKKAKIFVNKLKKLGFTKQAFVLEELFANGRGAVAATNKAEINALFPPPVRDLVLLRFYETVGAYCNTPLQLKEKTNIENTKKEKAYASIFKIGIFVMAVVPLFLAGMVILFVFLVSLFKGKRYVEEKITDKTSLPQAWSVFLLWDMLHLLLGFGLYALGVKIYSMLSVILVYCALSIIILLIIYRISGLKQFFISQSSTLRDILWGIGGYCVILPVMVFASVVNEAIFKDTEISSNPVFDLFGKLSTPLDYFLMFCMVVIIGPLVEEIIFRGYLFTAVRKYFRFGMSLLMVSFLFSFIHADLFALLPILCIGLVLGTVYEYTGSVVSSFITHALWNMNTFLAFILFFK